MNTISTCTNNFFFRKLYITYDIIHNILYLQSIDRKQPLEEMKYKTEIYRNGQTLKD